MQCPRCVLRIHRGSELCPHCGFSLNIANHSFIGEPISTGLLEDSAGILRRSDIHRLESKLERLRHRFPQLFFAIHIRSFRVRPDLQVFGFWALNNAVFRELGNEISNSSGILLVMDVESKQAALTFGYKLDPYLDTSDTYACLAKAQPAWVNHFFADGILALLNHMEGVLIRKHQMHLRDADAFASKVIAPQNLGAIAQRIRSNAKDE